MQSVAEVSLPELPIDEPGFAIDPEARFAEARRSFTGVWGIRGLPISFSPAPRRDQAVS